MLVPRLFIGVLLVQLLWVLTPCYAQQIQSDTVFLTSSKKKSISFYTASMQHQSLLYNGSDYIFYLSKEEEHPYFGSDDWAFGSVTYWGELYEDVPLLYDLSVDQVITEHSGGNPLKLIPEKVQRFSLLNHTFVRLYRDDKNKISDGFYDLLYDGKSKVYAKHVKIYGEVLEPNKIIPRFDENSRYYVVVDGVFNIAKSKGSVLEILNDRKQDIKNFIRKNRIRFKDNRASAIVRVTEFYDTLNN